jgi:hypothetical protein
MELKIVSDIPVEQQEEFLTELRSLVHNEWWSQWDSTVIGPMLLTVIGPML